MTTSPDPEIYYPALARIQQETTLPLALDSVITHRRGTAVLRLTDGTQQYAAKIAFPSETPAVGKGYDPVEMLLREARLLPLLSEIVGDQYIAHQAEAETPWLLLRWLEGKPAMAVCRNLRQMETGAALQEKLLAVFSAILQTTAALHQRGYTHGDLQPAHYLIRPDGTAALLDLALAQSPTDRIAYRGGMIHFLPPETAASLLSETDPVLFDPLAEVYSTAAVLFYLYTGQHVTRYDLISSDAPTRKEMLTAIAHGPYRTLADTDAAPFPALTSLLTAYLQPDRAKRVPSGLARRFRCDRGESRGHD